MRFHPHACKTKQASVTITGRAIERGSEQIVANAPLSLVLTIRGFERIFSVITDAEGHFEFTFPADNDSGRYAVSVVHPSMLSRPAHGEFVIQTATISPQEIQLKIPRNYTQKVPIKVVAGYETPLNDLVLVPAETTTLNSQGISVNFEALPHIPAQQSAYFNLLVTGDNSAPAQGRFSYRVEVEGFTGDNALGTVTVNYQLSEAKPALRAQPSHLETGIGLDQQRIESVVSKIAA